MPKKVSEQISEYLSTNNIASTDGNSLGVVVTSSDTSTDNNIATFDGTSGQTIQDSGYSIDQSLLTTSSPTFAGLTLTGDLTTSGTIDGIDIATDVAANTTHSSSDGTDHANVVLNDTHRASDGTDHTYIDQDLQTSASPEFVNLTLDSGRPLVSTASKTYYVDEASGSDSNGGESSGDAFATMAKAWGLVPLNLFHSYTIKVIGNYSTDDFTFKGVNTFDGANITIEGNTTTASNQVVTSASGLIVEDVPGEIYIKYLEFNCSAITSNCTCFTTATCTYENSGDTGLELHFTTGYINTCDFGTDVNVNCVYARKCSHVLVLTCSGNGTSYGVQANLGGYAGIQGGTLTGTTANSVATSGGTIA